MAAKAQRFPRESGCLDGADSELLTLALDTIDEAIGIYDSTDRLVAFNAHYHEVRSAIGGEVHLGVRWDDLVIASVRSGKIPEALGREEAWLTERRQLRGQYSIIRQVPDGRWYQVNERRMSNGGVAVVWTDISKLVRTEQQLESERHRVLEELLHVSRLSTAGQMASMLAHEMNQPLTAITNYLSAMRRGLVNASADTARIGLIAERAYEQTERAGEILRRFRDFLRRGRIELRPMDLNDVVAEALQLFAVTERASGIRIIPSFVPGLPPVMIDRVLLQQLVINLVKNAADALRDFEDGRVHISTAIHQDARRVHLIIADNGPGVAPEVADRLFQPFATTKTEGMGLGLSICRDIANEHRGTLKMSANHPTGAAFTLELPVVI